MNSESEIREVPAGATTTPDAILLSRYQAKRLRKLSKRERKAYYNLRVRADALAAQAAKRPKVRR